DAHFFDDLGADSMVLARFCARVRKRPELPSASMQDVYQHPTVRDLAAALAGPVGGPARAEPAAAVQPVPEAPVPRHSWEFVSCGVLQLLVFLGWTYLATLVAMSGYDWISAVSGVVPTYLRTVLVGGAYLIGMCTLPIVVKWVLIGRWRP
ncbi:acyl carrier protein, partial [Rhodococcus sp. A14]|uniref:phosphopantetheine-binding protein n=1 Tax=Rhodococcus sp. A14 TaxID=1194106 RepID=UPI0019809B14|nr:peptide synthetase [Rhodococcus sp. A14]